MRIGLAEGQEEAKGPHGEAEYRRDGTSAEERGRMQDRPVASERYYQVDFFSFVAWD